MPLRKGKCYSGITRKPYTRKSKKRVLNYIKVVPQTKVPRFNSGDSKGFNSGKYKFLVSLITKKEVQLRDNAIESARQEVHKKLEAEMKGNFFLSVRAYPHHVLREHALGSVAGSDRMTTGMAHSFGKSMGIAARLNANQKIFAVACNAENAPKVRKIFDKVRPKIPGDKGITVEPLNIYNPMIKK